MQVTLPADLQEFVDRQVRQGAYRTPAEVVVDGLRILAEAARRDARLADLRREVQEGIDSLAEGRVPLEDVRAEYRAKDRTRGRTAP